MNQNQPLISVIVPIYNVEIYIERCVSSIMDQTYKNIEIILVDDGSPDKSGQIADELAKTDFRIKVIHQKNAGVSTARNVGLDAATGEYVAFIDGDDYIAGDCISYFVKLIQRTDCDMAISKNHFSVAGMDQDEEKTCILTAEDAIEAIYLGKIDVAVWNKFYRRSFLERHNLRFHTEIWYGEGMLFNIECLQLTDSVALGQRKVYYQTYNPKSAMRNFNLESNYCGLRSLDIQKSIWKKKTNRIELAWTYHHRCFSNSILCGLVKTNTVAEHKEEYQKCINNLRRNVHIPLMVDIPLKRKLYYIVASLCPVLLAKRNAWKERRLLRRITDEI